MQWSIGKLSGKLVTTLKHRELHTEVNYLRMYIPLNLEITNLQFQAVYCFIKRKESEHRIITMKMRNSCNNNKITENFKFIYNKVKN